MLNAFINCSHKLIYGSYCETEVEFMNALR